MMSLISIVTLLKTALLLLTLAQGANVPPALKAQAATVANQAIAAATQALGSRTESGMIVSPRPTSPPAGGPTLMPTPPVVENNLGSSQIPDPSPAYLPKTPLPRGMSYGASTALPASCRYLLQGSTPLEIYCDPTVSRTVVANVSRIPLWFVNNTSKIIRLEGVEAAENSSDWSEFCVNIGSSDVGDFLAPPGQRTFAKGEVGCMNKLQGQTTFAPITWNNGYSSTGLAIFPNEKVLVGKNWTANSASATFTVTFFQTDQKTVLSIRQPKIDEIITCDGSDQMTVASPWINTSLQPITVTAALLEASNGLYSTQVNFACVASIAADGTVIQQICDPKLASSGYFQFSSPLSVPPGGALQARAGNSCTTGAAWDWAGYFIGQY